MNLNNFKEQNEGFETPSSGIMKLIYLDDPILLGKALDLYPVLVDYKDDNGRTWLHAAADLGLWACMDVLKKKGLDVNTQDKFGDTPLHRSLTQSRTEASKWLLENKADPNITNKAGVSPVLLAAAVSEEMLLTVLSHHGFADAQDNFGLGITDWSKRAKMQSTLKPTR